MFSGYHGVYDSDFEDAIAYARQAGFDYVSFDLHVPRFYVDQLDNGQLDALRAAFERNGVGLAFHAPGDNVSLFADFPAIRNGIVGHFSAIIRAAERLGARHVVVHTGAYPSFRQADKREDDFIREHDSYYRAVLHDNLIRLAEQTDRVMLCVENWQWTPLTMDVIDKALARCDRLFLTWDLAKTYDKRLQVIPEVEAFMWTHQERIREVHIHDVIEGFGSHQIVGQGAIPFHHYVGILNRPDVAVTIEVRPREAALLSRQRLEAILEGRGNAS